MPLWQRQEVQEVLRQLTVSSTCKLHEGGREHRGSCFRQGILVSFWSLFSTLQFVLFGLRPHWTSHLRRSLSNHSFGYAFSTDQPNCFAHHALIPEPFMRFAG
jgi:hypothetical protein